MFQRPDMKAEDFTCLMCGTKLGIKLHDMAVGDNRGECRECSEPYNINITKEEMKALADAEKKNSPNRHIL